MAKVFLHVTVQVNRGKTGEWSKLYEELFVPLCKKHGQKLVAVWKTTFGVYDEITDVYEFESLAEMEKIRAALGADPATGPALQKIQPLSGYEVSKLMVAMPYSPLK
jgi:hypothetical protein